MQLPLNWYLIYTAAMRGTIPWHTVRRFQKYMHQADKGAPRFIPTG